VHLDAIESFIYQTDAIESFIYPTNAKESFIYPTDAKESFIYPTDAIESFIYPTDAKESFIYPTDAMESFIYPTDVQLDCSKNVKIYIRGAATCFGFPQPSPGSYYMCFAKIIIINNQLKYVLYRISSV